MANPQALFKLRLSLVDLGHGRKAPFIFCLRVGIGPPFKLPLAFFHHSPEQQKKKPRHPFGHFSASKNKKVRTFYPEPSKVFPSHHTLVGLITTPAIPVLQGVHHRMPFILRLAAYRTWPDPQKTANPS